MMRRYIEENEKIPAWCDRDYEERDLFLYKYSHSDKEFAWFDCANEHCDAQMFMVQFDNSVITRGIHTDKCQLLQSKFCRPR